MTTPHKKFGFDTVFDSSGDIAYAPPQIKRVFTPDEVEQIRAAAYAEGQRTATVRAEEAQANALNEITRAARAALGALAEAAHNHRIGAAELALATAKVIAGAALEQFPQAPVTAALQSLSREVEAIPRLMVRTEPGLVDRTQVMLEEAAQACGISGQILVKADSSLPPAAFVIDWGDGRASFDPVEAEARVSTALRTALIAEGLHAEPLPPLAGET